jgi:molybdopterin/thiamine biosynthesis adenylyltransferase
MIKEIKTVAVPKKMPDGTSYHSISVEQTTTLANRFNVRDLTVEISALEADIVPERYSRNMKTYSTQDQATLLKSMVSVVGLGGLGGAATEILARSGVGTLNLIDGDTFEESNLNRQFFCTQDLLLKSKAGAAKRRVNEINSSIVAQQHNEFLQENNVVRILENSDAVIDCLDNLNSRFLLEGATKKAGIPLVSAAVAGVSGHVTSIFHQDQGLRLIYGEPERLPQKGAETSLGCLPQAVTIMAALETSEVIKILLKKGNVLRNRLLIVDLTDHTMEVLDLL